LAGNIERIGEKRNVYRLYVRKTVGKRSLGRPSCKLVNNIKMYLVKIGLGGMDWIGLAQNKGKWEVLVNTVMNV
jgi:hypothetical protein